MEQIESKPKFHEQAKYRIHVCGVVEDSWTDYFSGMTIRVKDEPEQEPETNLTGWVADQAALLGVLSRLHDWGHVLISIEYISGD